MRKNVRIAKPWYSRITHYGGKWARNRAADAISTALRFVPGVSPYWQQFAGNYYKRLIPYGKYKPYWSAKRTGSVRLKNKFSSNRNGPPTGSNPPGPPTGSNPGGGKVGKKIHVKGYMNFGVRKHRTHKRAKQYFSN